eukprot:CAMPEP_0117444004 /NCGR_PEP_ID=MMETSP0759-20121206/5004_1 /TAXON_ID=63605 /ORGANISM="Percolomonas cosmopolitus, Strain WS" /LENGTH=455 /DNA_ID=CAMNT_0005236031 /DNA_START=114 /DNA_END=1478 /DNA_ORIENTATION=+
MKPIHIFLLILILINITFVFFQCSRIIHHLSTRQLNSLLHENSDEEAHVIGKFVDGKGPLAMKVVIPEGEPQHSHEPQRASPRLSKQDMNQPGAATNSNPPPSQPTLSQRDQFFAKQQQALPHLYESCQYQALEAFLKLQHHKIEPRKEPIKIYDGFTFNNEFEMLEVRLRTLSSVVDYFVIVEAPLSFQNKPKPLHFKNKIEEGWNVFEEFKHQILHVVVESKPPIFEYWENEVHFRNAIGTEGLAIVAMDRPETRPQDTDIILVTDVDEIVHPDVLGMFKYLDGWPQQLYRVQMRWTYYNYLWENQGKSWKMCVGVTWGALKNAKKEANQVRYNCLGLENLPTQVLDVIPQDVHQCHAGWHCSSCMHFSKFHSKVSSFAHSEHMEDFEKNQSRLEEFVREGIWYQSGKRQGVYISPEDLSETAIPNWLREEGAKVHPFLLPEEKPRRIANDIW